MLIDCTEHTESELIIVEGKDAANALKRVCNRRNQAILGLQGKLPNAAKASSEGKLLKNPQIANLIAAIDPGASSGFCFDQLRYHRLVIFTDPDADGLHARVLIVLLFYLHLRFVIEQGRLFVGYAPLYSLDCSQLENPVIAFTTNQYHQLIADLVAKGITDAVTTRFKGLASMDQLLLSRCCVNRDSRMVKKISIADCEAMLRPLGV